MSWGMSREDIATLRVGDEIGVSAGGWNPECHVAKVTRRTATRVIVGDKAFGINGYEIGNRSSYSAHLIPAPEARTLAIEIATEKRLKRARRMLEVFKWGGLSQDECDAVLTLLASFKADVSGTPQENFEAK